MSTAVLPDLKQWMTTYQAPTSSPRKSILLLDGGTSTHLEEEIKREQHSSCQQSPNSSIFPIEDLWSSSLLLDTKGRDRIRSCHQQFYHAGSDIVTTVTYQCSHHICNSTTLCREKVDDMLRLALHLANEARHATITSNKEKIMSPKFIAVSLGCYGAALADGSEYTGHYSYPHSKEEKRLKQNINENVNDDEHVVVNYDKTVSDHQQKLKLLPNEPLSPPPLSSHLNYLIQFHKRRLQIFLDENTKLSRQTQPQDKIITTRPPGYHFGEQKMLDAIAFETIPSLLELQAILTLLRQIIPTIPRSSKMPAIWISLACSDDKHLNDGHHFDEAVQLIHAMDPNATLIQGIGVNCFHIQYLQSLVKQITTHVLSTQTCRTILFYPNSGEMWDTTHQKWVNGTGITTSSFADQIINCTEMVREMCLQWNYSRNDNNENEINHDQMHPHSASSFTSLKTGKLPSLSKQSKLPRMIPMIVGGCCRTTTDTIHALRCRLE